jgi:hypothetical protein
MQRRLLLHVMMLIIQIIAVTVSSNKGDNIVQTKRKRRAVFDIIPYKTNIKDLSFEKTSGEKQWNLFKLSENSVVKQSKCGKKKKCISRLKKSFELWKTESKALGNEVRSRSSHYGICCWKLIVCLCYLFIL